MDLKSVPVRNKKGRKDTANCSNYKTKSDACDGRMKFRGVNSIFFCYKYLFLNHISIKIG